MSSRNALLIRVDRIGDLCLTLPSDEIVKRAGFESVQWLYPQGLDFVVSNAVPRRQGLGIQRGFKIAVFWRLFKWLQKEKFSLSISYHAPWWINFALWLARIPSRAGVASQWHSFVFLNRRIRQKRSLAEKSEFDYNFDLTRAALQSGFSTAPALTLKANSSIRVETFNLRPKEYIIVHPGMAGSARNWPAQRYSELIQKLLTHTVQVVVTGTAVDRQQIDEVRTSLGPAASQVQWLNEKLDGESLLAVLAGATRVVAPSTGVIHLAAALSIPVVGIYSPVKVQHPRRWGPVGHGANLVQVVLPDVNCPGTLRCELQKCPRFDCMQLISAEQIESRLIDAGTPRE